jgi:hypothetical protein
MTSAQEAREAERALQCVFEIVIARINRQIPRVFAAEPLVRPREGSSHERILSLGKQGIENGLDFTLNGGQIARVHGGEHVCTMGHWPEIEILFCSANLPEQTSLHLQE